MPGVLGRDWEQRAAEVHGESCVFNRASHSAVTTHVRILSHAVMIEHKLTLSEVWSRCNNVFGAGELIPGSFSELMLSVEGHELGMSV